MGILNWLFTSKPKRFDNLFDSFEYYISELYEKSKIVSEVYHKRIEIENKGQFSLGEEKQITTQKHYGYSFTQKEGKLYDYYKGWVNRKLKRILKILNFETKTAKEVISEDKDIIHIVNEIIEMKGVTGFSTIKKSFEQLKENLSKQKEYLDEIHPIKHWTLDVHKSIFTDDFLQLLNKEIDLVFGSHSNLTYEGLQGIIAEKMASHSIPQESLLKELVEKGRLYSKRDTTPVKCYHGTTIFARYSIFPIKSEKRTWGFYIFSKKDHVKSIIAEIYKEEEYNIVVYEITMPKFLFETAVDDKKMNEDVPGYSDTHVFRPSTFPLLNQYYLAGKLTIKRLHL